MDDARPREGDSLREMARVIRLYDRRPDGSPYRHVGVMGVGGNSADIEAGRDEKRLPGAVQAALQAKVWHPARASGPESAGEGR